ncbi:MAG: beta-ketoacyl-[acyl-carrier-protein] synthase family protein, partial [bacterium]
MNDRVVITGIGVLSPIGMGKEAFWQGLERSHAIKPITLFDTSDLKCTQAAEITDFNVKDHLSQRGLKYLSRSAQLACAATALALEDAALDLSAVDPPEVGVVIGTAFGNVNSMIAFDKEAWLEGPRFVNPMTFPNTVVNSPAGYISVLFGLTGLNATISTGRSSSLEALKYAAECLKRGEARVVLAGGCEELSEFVHLGFLKAGQLSGSKGDGIEKPAPLDRRRNGFVLGEGAVILSLERSDHAQSRGAHILAEIAGYGDAYAPAGSGFDGFEVKAEAEAMRRALLSSRLDPEDIGFIS